MGQLCTQERGEPGSLCYQIYGSYYIHVGAVMDESMYIHTPCRPEIMPKLVRMSPYRQIWRGKHIVEFRPAVMVEDF